MSTAVYRGKVLTNSGLLDDALVVTLRDRISDIRPAGDYNGPATTAEYILPGLIDLHNHGGAGEGFPTSTLNGCRRAARHHRAHGTTTLLASLVSAPGDHLVEQTALLADLADEGEIDGVHMEGPFVNSVRCGAQDPAAIIPGDPELFERVAKAGRGWLKTITFAPETANMDGLLRVCATYDVVASLGHTDADFDTTLSVIDRATKMGVTVTATHLFNAMPQLHHRNPGAAAALIDAAALERLFVELVADGVHLDDRTVDVVWDTVGTSHSFFVTDAMAATGMSDGAYILGDLAVSVDGGVARLSAEDGGTGAIAGGTSHMCDQLRRHVQRGRKLDDAVSMASTTAARALGLADRGSIAVGNRADLLLCNNNFEPTHVVRAGEAVPADPVVGE